MESEFDPEYWQQLSIFDIAANMADGRYQGIYRGQRCHAPDFQQCIDRANMFGVKKFLFAATLIKDARASYALSLKSNDFYATVGLHPVRALDPYRKALGRG